MIHFDSDYMETCHPLILEKLSKINLQKLSGYGTDDICETAKEKIRKACSCPEAEIFFLVGGTQTNATVLDGLLQKYDENHTVVRFASSWATTPQQIQELKKEL